MQARSATYCVADVQHNRLFVLSASTLYFSIRTEILTVHINILQKERSLKTFGGQLDNPYEPVK